ncbi:MAG: sulfurtransferase TusA family protein [Deltaproteobacteria bacterium]|nr:sulfurtransferase TusA family protein [Deltaproteobacteria bacterium]
MSRPSDSPALEPKARLDICSAVCPMTFVLTKAALDDLEEGEILAVRLNDGEPAENMPRSLKDEGHQVLKLRDNHDGTFELLVRRGS